MADLIFEIPTPLGMTVRCTVDYWDFIVSQKHPILRNHQTEVEDALRDPDEIRKSKKDPAVLLFYKGAHPRWLCAVTKIQNGDGFLITAYPTDAIKAGELVWKK